MAISNEVVSDIVSRLRKLGFSNNQIKNFFINSDHRFFRKMAALEENFENYRVKMIQWGYSDYQLYELATYIPTVIFNPQIRKSYKAFLASLPDEETINSENESETVDVIELLIDMGVNEYKISSILNEHMAVSFMTKEEILSNINFYKSLSLSEEDIVYAINQNGRILEFGANDYKEVLEKLKTFGINKVKFGLMIMKAAKHKMIIESNKIMRVLDWALSKQLDYECFGVSLSNTVVLANYSEYFLDNGFDNILKLGFSEAEVCYLISMSASILAMDYDNLRDKFNVPRIYGVSAEDTRKIIIGFPDYLTLSVENLKEKFRAYKRYGLLSFVIDNPKNIRQGADLVEARACYLKRYYPGVKRNYFSQMVFTSEEIFKSKFNGSNKYIKSLNLNGRS